MCSKSSGQSEKSITLTIELLYYGYDDTRRRIVGSDNSILLLVLVAVSDYKGNLQHSSHRRRVETLILSTSPSEESMALCRGV